MSEYDLKGMQASSLYQLEQAIGSIPLAGEWDVFRDKTRKICDHFLTLAAASLLADMKVQFFFQNLCRSAENWRRFLVSSRDFFSQQPTLNYNLPLYAAIIANDITLLKGLSDALPKQYLPGEEYEDKFIICKLHITLALNNCAMDDEVESLLVQLSQAEVDPNILQQFKSLLALEDLNEADFWLSFDDAIYAHEANIETAMNLPTTQISQFIAQRFIWFQGLAWLRLAMMRGYQIPSRAILYCPDEALESMEESYVGDWSLVPVPSDNKNT